MSDKIRKGLPLSMCDKKNFAVRMYTANGVPRGDRLTLGLLFPDVCHSSHWELDAGIIEKGIFYPKGLLAYVLFYEQHKIDEGREELPLVANDA